MKNGFIRVGCATPKCILGNIQENEKAHIEAIQKADLSQCKVLLFPELSLTGASCGDVFYRKDFLIQCQNALKNILASTANTDVLFFVGMPFLSQNKIYNVLCVCKGGECLAVLPKENLEDSEKRVFSSYTSGTDDNLVELFHGLFVPFTTNLSIPCKNLSSLFVSSVIGDITTSSLWKKDTTDISLLLNPFAFPATFANIKKNDMMAKALTKKFHMAMICAASGISESTSSYVYYGKSAIYYDGELVTKSDDTFDNTDQLLYADLDMDVLFARKSSGMRSLPSKENADYIGTIVFRDTDYPVAYPLRKDPFLSEFPESRLEGCMHIVKEQAYALAMRVKRSYSKKMIVGLSGGLDSTLAFLVAYEACKILSIEPCSVIALTMPGFGTTQRTKGNAELLAVALGAEFREISIAKSVLQHFEDIGQDANLHDVTYENAQARERTQILMDIANQENGLVVGTGDLSEIALGWSTFNGDHMSMYAVNADVPKTMIRFIVEDYAQNSDNAIVKKTLLDILATPVSPELLPPKEGEIQQKTEGIVGPYELHDFFLYYFVKEQMPIKKLYRVAVMLFKEEYSSEEILRWLTLFLKRFYTQQFKRSCSPDAPIVCEMNLVKGEGYSQPSDISYAYALKELEELKNG